MTRGGSSRKRQLGQHPVQVACHPRPRDDATYRFTLYLCIAMASVDVSRS